MEDGSITNDQITANSYAYSFYPWEARLNNANSWLSSAGSPWIQVAFPSAVDITGLQTQGSIGWTYVTQLQVQIGDSEDTLSYVKDGNETAVSLTSSCTMEEKSLFIHTYLKM